MKNKKDEKPEPASEEVELVVTPDNYEAGLKRGWTDDDMLKPGRYKMKRGGFLARHRELKLPEKFPRLTTCFILPRGIRNG